MPAAGGSHTTWPITPVDGDLILDSGAQLTLNGGDVKVYRDIIITNGSSVLINGSVQIGFTRNFTLDATSFFNAQLNNSLNGYDPGSGVPAPFTYGPYTAPDGSVYSYNVVGAVGGIGGNDANSIHNGGFPFFGSGGGGASDTNDGGQGLLGQGGEGAGSEQAGPGPGGLQSGGNGDEGGDNGTGALGGGGGGGGGVGNDSYILYLKGGPACNIVNSQGSFEFDGVNGGGGGPGGQGGSNVSCDNAGGGGGAAGGIGGLLIVKLPTAKLSSWTPDVVISGGSGGIGGEGGSSPATADGNAGSDASPGQNGTYTLSGY